MTNEEISKLSDRDLTFEIAKVAYFGTRYNIIKNRNEILLTFKGSTVESLNYCNSWNDLMPLVEKYKIKIIPKPDLDDWVWECRNVHIRTVKNKNLQRALAECLYKVLLNIKGGYCEFTN